MDGEKEKTNVTSGLEKTLRSLYPAERNLMLILLTWVAGTIDAISYFELGHVFTANMTGNTVLLGLDIAQSQAFASLRSAAALLGFAIGVAIGAVIVGRDRKKGEWPPVVTLAVVFEAVIVGVFTVSSRIAGISLSGDVVYPLIILFGLAMGIQSAAIRHLDVAGVATTYLTGTLTSLVVGVMGWMGPADLSSVSSSTQKRSGVKLLAAVYAIYFLGAMVGGFVEIHTQHWAVLLPLTALIIVAVIGSFRHYH